jgi:hypothetical protein
VRWILVRNNATLQFTSSSESSKHGTLLLDHLYVVTVEQLRLWSGIKRPSAISARTPNDHLFVIPICYIGSTHTPRVMVFPTHSQELPSQNYVSVFLLGMNLPLCCWTVHPFRISSCLSRTNLWKLTLSSI